MSGSLVIIGGGESESTACQKEFKASRWMRRRRGLPVLDVPQADRQNSAHKFRSRQEGGGGWPVRWDVIRRLLEQEAERAGMTIREYVSVRFLQSELATSILREVITYLLR